MQRMQKSYLVPVEGPLLAPLILERNDRSSRRLALGRNQLCALRLPASAEQVSRSHCTFRFGLDQWHVTDKSSRLGTFVNGVRLVAERETPLVMGDLIRIAPWTFELCDTLARRGTQSDDDRGLSTIHSLHQLDKAAAGPMDADLLGLLLEASAVMQATRAERALAECALDAAIRGTGFPNGAVLRSVDSSGQVEVVAFRKGDASDQHVSFSFSRSLLAAAADGQIAEINSESSGVGSQTIVAMNITAAVCVPLALGPSTVFYLYLDSRSERQQVHAGRQPLRPTMLAFVAALGQMAGLAMANLKSVELEQRQLFLGRELQNARVAQELLMPRCQKVIGKYHCVGKSKPGQMLSGDFFDLIDLDNGKFALALGDVSGKGVGASVLMATAIGFLHSALRQVGEPSRALTALNQYLASRRRDGQFVTLWVGIFDTENQELQYVDAGHGYAMLIGADGLVTMLNVNSGLPIGIDDGTVYHPQKIQLPDRGTILVISDGVVDQQERSGAAEATNTNRFDMNGIHRTILEKDQDDELAPALFKAITAYAGTDQLSDDVTAVSVKWDASRVYV